MGLVTIKLDGSGYDHKRYEVVNKIVDIEVALDGTIKIKGGLFVSTTVSKDKWQKENGRELLERGLMRAYKHPRVKVGEEPKIIPKVNPYAYPREYSRPSGEPGAGDMGR